MTKIDYKKTLKYLYAPSAKKIQFVDVPELNYLTVSGIGRPEGENYQNALRALYPVAYKIKFWMKEHQQFDYVVPPLEGLWWADDMADFENGSRDKWLWTMMIMQPENVTQEVVTRGIDTVSSRKEVPCDLHKVEFISFNEGRCAQTLHLGPFSEEGPVIQRIHSAINDEGCNLAGKHHEIYLSDMRRVPPEKYRTIIRQPMI